MHKIDRNIQHLYYIMCERCAYELDAAAHTIIDVQLGVRGKKSKSMEKEKFIIIYECAPQNGIYRGSSLSIPHLIALFHLQSKRKMKKKTFSLSVCKTIRLDCSIESIEMAEPEIEECVNRNRINNNVCSTIRGE